MADGSLLRRTLGCPVVDLAHPWSADMPQWPGHPPFILHLARRHGDTFRPQGYSSANEVIVTSGHTGTHLDGLGHISCNGALFGNHNAQETQTGPRGLRDLGMEQVAPIVRRGVLLDLATQRGTTHLAHDCALTAVDLALAEAQGGVLINAGDVVLIRTGWGSLWSEPQEYVNLRTGWPGPDSSAADWLASRKIFATGSDTITYERYDPATGHLPVHLKLIQEAGIHLLENLDLEALSKLQVKEFLFVCLPLTLVGATGSPVRPIAILTEGA
ncbi:MAG: cyclase family protein [Chloroflexi bacterium]|nr:cyclase family protein [Chloroflexota bacterium]